MTVATTARYTDVSAPLPAMGTLPSAANQLFYRLTMVSRDAAGRAVVPTDGDGFNVQGVTRATVDNRTGSPEHGGDADAVDIELDYGVFGFDIDGTTPLPGQVVYAVNNATVSTDSDTGARGIAGVCIEVRDGQCYTFTSPLASGLYGDGAAVASDVTDLQTDVAALQADALSATHRLAVPLTAFRATTDGAAIPAWGDGTAMGFSVVNSEILGIRWNPSQATSIIGTVPLPADLDAAEDVVVQFTGFRIGASDAAMVLAVGAFMVAAGEAHNADSNAGGNTTAFDGATNVLTTETLTLAAANVPAAPALLTLTIAPDAALDADDFVLTGIELVYTGALLT